MTYQKGSSLLVIERSTGLKTDSGTIPPSVVLTEEDPTATDPAQPEATIKPTTDPTQPTVTVEPDSENVTVGILTYTLSGKNATVTGTTDKNAASILIPNTFKLVKPSIR